jgi:hypothetical protein
MTATDDIRDIFGILHDGDICGWTGDKNLLTLRIECLYLAERIDKSYDSFFVDLVKVDTLHLTTWPNPRDLPVLNLTDIEDIFKANLEILSADKTGDKVVVVCSQHDTSFDYCGGNLTIGCERIKIYDQNKNELTIDDFDSICKSYWDDMSKEQEKRLTDKSKP